MTSATASVRRASALLGFCVIAPFAPARAARAQSAADASGITLQRALDEVLVNGVQLQLAERQVRVGEGTLLVARAPFDPQLVTSLSTERSNAFTGDANAGPDAVLTRTITSAMALPKHFLSGVAVTPRIEMAQSEVPDIPGSPTSRASVTLEVSVPLLRDRGGGVIAATERAARYSLDAARLEARHAAAAAVLATALAYWNDLAAEERLAVYRSSEERASQLVQDTRRLVEADERPAADLQQLLANLALKKAARLAGEQASVEAREQLALAIGRRTEELTQPIRATGGFPAVPPGAFPDTDFDTPAVVRAAGRRADLAALRAARTASEERFRGALNGLRPRLDLSMAIGYQGLTTERGIRGALSSLHRNVPGLDASVQLSYGLPLASLAAHGETLRSRAAYDQARIREAELARQISSGVRAGRAALRHGREALLASRDAVALSRRAVENEKRKFQLGMSTLFDVILAEDALTNARLSEISGQQAYAAAIARVRYETGTILGVDGDAPRVSAATLKREP